MAGPGKSRAAFSGVPPVGIAPRSHSSSPSRLKFRLSAMVAGPQHGVQTAHVMAGEPDIQFLPGA